MLKIEHSSLTLYELYSFYFEGKITCDGDMKSIIEVGLKKDSQYCYCFKVGATFSCVCIVGGTLRTLFNIQFSDIDNSYNVGRFIKKLHYAAATNGYNINKVTYVVWDNSDISENFRYYFKSVCFLSKQLVGYDNLRHFFKRIDYTPMQTTNINAQSIINALNINFSGLGIREKDGLLYFGKTFMKDYSIYNFDFSVKSKYTYGVIIDCEGVKGADGDLSNGCSEIGGLIYVKVFKKLFILETFKADRELIDATLKEVAKRYLFLSGSRKVPIITYGASDKIMLGHCCNKSTLNKFNFINCINFVSDNLCDCSSPTSITGICRNIGVLYKKPIHDPLNDAKTLFNILAYIAEVYSKTL